MIVLSLIPSHEIASWLISGIGRVLEPFGLGSSGVAHEFVYVAVIVAISLLVGWGLRRLVLAVASRLPFMGRSEIGREMTRLRTLQHCSHFISPLVFLAFVPFAFTHGEAALVYLTRVALVYLLVTVAVAVNAVLEVMWENFNSVRNTKGLPLRGLLNVGRGIVWIIIVIVSASVLLDKSPAALLAGLGAFAAALMLIFRDSILGFVAGLQLSNNDVVRVGDWIVVPGTPADGTVLDVTLTAVKVMNWDNTTAMLPPHTLVSGSFQNYRSMYQSGGRRVMVSVYVDPCTVSAATDELYGSVASELPLMGDYIAKVRGEGGLDLGGDPLQSGCATNLGLLRAYLYMYLGRHPKVNQSMTVLVRLLQEEEFGIPLQVYCFSATTDWIAYEQIGDEIVEHVLSVARLFGVGLSNYSNYDVALTGSGK